jgi:hypothetical protein
MPLAALPKVELAPAIAIKHDAVGQNNLDTCPAKRSGGRADPLRRLVECGSLGRGTPARRGGNHTRHRAMAFAP